MVDRVLHSPMPFTTGGQTITDRLTAAKHSLAGSQLGKTVCKATTEECIGPKKKHLDYLLHCTNEPNISIPQLANLLIERTLNHNWCVVFKSLLTIHNLMCYGNERFTQYLASNNTSNFDLANFLDKTSVQGYDMSTHVRRYAKYISEKVYTYRLCAFDFCKVKRGKEDGMLRTMNTEKLLKTLPILQGQVDALLEFQVTASELTNGVINSCFILLFRDLIRLFACYNDGIINLLEKYFDMNKKQCKEALDLYKTFLTRMDRVAEFLKVAESVGIDKGEIPDLAKAPNSLLEALEQHLAALEGSKTTGSRAVSPIAGDGNTQNAIAALSSMTDGNFVDINSVDEVTKQKYLREEQERLNLLKEQRIREMEFSKGSQPPSSNVNPFLSGAGAATGGPPINLLDSPPGGSRAAAQSSKPSEDLFSLNTNPFMANVESISNATANEHPIMDGGFWSTGPTTSVPAAFNSVPVASSANAFTSDDAFAKAFDGRQAAPVEQGLDPLGDFLGGQSSSSVAGSSNKPQQNGKILKGDLDNSLANLAQNLNLGLDKSSTQRVPVQWSGGRPPAPMAGGGAPPGWNPPGMQGGQRPQYPGMPPQQPFPQQGWGGQPQMIQPGMMPPAQGYNQMPAAGMGQQPAGGGMMYGGGGPVRPGFPPHPSQQQSIPASGVGQSSGSSTAAPFDPFGM